LEQDLEEQMEMVVLVVVVIVVAAFLGGDRNSSPCGLFRRNDISCPGVPVFVVVGGKGGEYFVFPTADAVISSTTVCGSARDSLLGGGKRVLVAFVAAIEDSTL
jgi:hypothetical protein